jgi:hypothetical protein
VKELWEIFPRENDELNIWSKNISEFKKHIRRPTSIVLFTEAYVGRWDILANEIYQSPYLWWVIPVANDILDLLDPELVGSFLKVPHFLDVWEWMEWR